MKRWGGTAYEQAAPETLRTGNMADTSRPETYRSAGHPLPSSWHGQVRRVVIVHNSAVPWSLTTARYWAALRGVQCEYFGFDFGANAIDSTKGLTSQWSPDVADLWDDLVVPVGLRADLMDAHAVFMAPGVPLLINLTALDPNTETPRAGGFPLSLVFACCRGASRLATVYGKPLPDTHDTASGGSNSLRYTDTYLTSPEGAWTEADNASSFNYRGTFFSSLLRNRAVNSVPVLPEYYGADPVKILKYIGCAWGDESMRGQIAAVLPDDLYTAAAPSVSGTEEGAHFKAHCVLVGHIGKPLYPSLSSGDRGYMGDVTEAETIEIIESAVASEGSYRDHGDKPFWIGVHDVSSWDNPQAALCVDMLKRAGFSNVNYFYRTTPGADAAIREAYCPAAGKAFDYADIAGGGVAGLDCFMLLGGFRNGALTDTTPNGGQETDGVSGADVTGCFDYLPGALSFVFTSASALHPARCITRAPGNAGGVGGVGDCYENGGSPSKTAGMLQALLAGLSVAEAQYYNTDNYAIATVLFGDPLYAPFRYEFPRRDIYAEGFEQPPA